MRYSAFISYNHRDKAWARWLHQSLEKYVVPKHLREREGPFGPIAARLPPVFRDREELASSSDLAAAVKAALGESATLIVICSPNSAQSKWVNEEVKTFIEAGRRDRILCVIVAGEPLSTNPETECLPPALRTGAEPLAADARKNGDGKSLAKLKLLAGILDVPFDELRQREAQRRHRRLAYLAVASTAGLVLTSGLAVAAFLERNEAIEQRDVARVRTATAEQTVAFVTGMFQVADPTEARGSTITAREILDGARQRYKIALRNEPIVQSEIALTLSEVYGSLGLFHESDEIAGTIPAAGLKDPQVAMRQRIVLGEALFRRGEFEAAAAQFASALRASGSADETNPALLSRAYSKMGESYSALDKFAQSDEALRKALAIDRSRGDAGRRDVARDLEGLGLNRFYDGELAPAQKTIEQANAIRLSLEGPDSPSVSDNIGTLASIAYLQGRSADAEKLFRSRLAIDERVLGKDHPDVAITLNNIARILVVEKRDFAGAAPLLQRAIDITRRQRGDAYDDLAYMQGSMAVIEKTRGHDARAEALLREAIALGREQHHRSLGPNMIELARLLCDSKRFDEADRVLSEAAPLLASDYPGDTWQPAWLNMARAQCLRGEGRGDAARKIVDTALPQILKRWGPGSYYRREAQSISNLARA